MTPEVLRTYQEEAVAAAMPHDGFLLALEQRTGKTKIVFKIVQRRAPSRLLIECPKIAIDEIWMTELQNWDLPNTEVKIMTFEGAAAQRKKLRRWLEVPDSMVVGDEIQKAKKGGRGSRRGRASHSFARVARWRLATSGTPFDKPHDLWGVFEFVDPNLFGTWGEFRDRYCRMGGYMGRKIIGYKNEAELQRLVDSRMFRVLLADVQPVKTKINPPVRVRFRLKASMKHYRELEKDFMTVVNGRTVVAARAMTLAMKLHQCTGGWIKDTIDPDILLHVGSEKVLTLMRLLRRIKPDRFVIFARFIHELGDITWHLKAAGYTVTRISGKDKFSGFRTDAAVVQIQSGVSIDLAAAPICIFFSWDYSHLNHEQSKFRVLSYDRSPEVTYYYLVGWGTIDEELFEVVQTKLNVSAFLLNRYRGREKS